MKKVLVTIAGSLLGMAMFAQTITHADSIKLIAKSWRSNYVCTAHPKVVTLDFTDSTICPEYKAGTNSGTGNVLYQHGNVDFEPLGGSATTLSTYFSVSDGALRIDYRWALKIHFFIFDSQKPQNPLNDFLKSNQMYNSFLKYCI